MRAQQAIRRGIIHTLTKGVGGNVLRSRATNQPLRSRLTGQYLIRRKP